MEDNLITVTLSLAVVTKDGEKQALLVHPL